MSKFDLDMKIVPAFQSTLALLDKMCDCAHYPTSSKIPQLLALVDLLSSFGPSNLKSSYPYD